MGSTWRTWAPIVALLTGLVAAGVASEDPVERHPRQVRAGLSDPMPRRADVEALAAAAAQTIAQAGTRCASTPSGARAITSRSGWRVRWV